MAGERELAFPPRASPSLEDDLKREQRQFAASAGSVHTLADWDDILSSRPLDVPFLTALNGRATILIYFSSQSVPDAGVIQEVLSSRRPWLMHTSAFLQGPYPILRFHLVFPDNPQDPFFLEAPLDIRSGNVQDFCKAIMGDEHMDIILKHETQAEGCYATEFHGAGLAAILGREVRQVIAGMQPGSMGAEFRAGVRAMESAFRTPSDGIDRAKCVRLVLTGSARNKLIRYERG